MKTARLLDAGIEIGKTGDGLLDEIADTAIVIAQGQPVDPLAAHGGMSHPRDYISLGGRAATPARYAPVEACTMLKVSSTVIFWLPLRWISSSVRSRQGRISAALPTCR